MFKKHVYVHRSADSCSLQIVGDFQFPSCPLPYFPSLENEHILLLPSENNGIHAYTYLDGLIVKHEACLFVRQTNIISVLNVPL